MKNKEKKTLFTICIPTFNRGKTVFNLVSKLLLELKEDWEILVLDNASTRQKKYYKKILQLSQENKKIRYIKHKINGQFHGNYLACFKESSSKYIMVVSDEDFPVVSEIKELLQCFKTNRNLGIIRGSIGSFKNALSANAYELRDLTYKAGEEASFYFGFENNYISGIIYNRELIIKYNFLDLLNKNLIKYSIYPHLYLEFLVCTKCDVALSSKKAIYEGPPQLTKDEYGNTFSNTLSYQPPYSLGSRIDQFIGFRDAVFEVSKILKKPIDSQFFGLKYVSLVKKFYNLIAVANMPLYIDNKLEPILLIEGFQKIAFSSIFEYPELIPYKEDICKRINDFHIQYIDSIKQ